MIYEVVKSFRKFSLNTIKNTSQPIALPALVAK
jgi:hypothetical protein